MQSSSPEKKLEPKRSQTGTTKISSQNKLAIQNQTLGSDMKSEFSNAMDFDDELLHKGEIEVEIVKYELSYYRWVYLVFFTLAVSCGSIPPIGCATVATQLSEAYDVSIFMVNTVAISGQIAYVPMSFVAIWMYQNYSSVLSMRLSCVICLIGCWFRLISVPLGQSFWPYNVGTLIQSASIPLMLTGTTTFANFWMSDKERPFAIAITNMGVALGNMVSFVISGLYFAGVSKEGKTQAEVNAEYRTANEQMTLLQNYLCTGAYLIFFILVREKPKNPPSEAATHKIEQRSNFCKLMGVTMKKRSFQILVFAFLNGNGSYTALSAIMSQIFAPFGYSVGQITILAVLFIFVGVVCSLVFGTYLGRTRRYLCMTRFVVIGIFVVFTAAIFTFPTQIFWLCLINMILGGAALLPIVPVGIAFGQELCRPMHPGISNGTLLMSGRLSGCIYSYAGSYFAGLDPEKPTYALVFFAIINGFSAIAILFIKEDFEPIIDKESLASIMSAKSQEDELEERNKHAMLLRKSFDEVRASMRPSETRPRESESAFRNAD